MRDRQRILKNKDLSKGEQLTAVGQCACTVSAKVIHVFLARHEETSRREQRK